jgi:hypothetical protein
MPADSLKYGMSVPVKSGPSKTVEAMAKEIVGLQTIGKSGEPLTEVNPGEVKK